MSASATASSSRARPQARKKANDDASYFGPSTLTASTTGNKRQAADKLDGEPRVKRKRVDATAVTQTTAAKRDTVESEVRLSMVEFNKMSVESLERYLAQFDIIPAIYPSPVLPDDPPAPVQLGTAPRQSSRALSPAAAQTPANRPRRESREANRRSSRLLEEDLPYRTPSLTDLCDLQVALAKIVEKHFRESLSISQREEVDALSAFMAAVDKSRKRNRS